MRYIIKFILAPILFLCLIVLGINLYILSFSEANIYSSIELLPEKKVWLIFWASVYRNWNPSPILRDRLDGWYDAYVNWKIQRIIVSWDNSVEKYDEPTAMAEYLIGKWVKKEDIFLDYAGFDTFDSLYRAEYIFWTTELILFTQTFHLERALYIAEGLGLEAIWFATDQNRYINEGYNNRREIFARTKAFIEIELFDSKPKFLWETISIP